MIITIDGPAGAGKSTAARLLARRLSFRFLDTGAMYRTVALAARRAGIAGSNRQAMADLAGRISIELDGDRVLLDGEDVTAAIRTSEVTAATRHAADNPAVRARLVQLQREAARGNDIVTEGRDQGTLVFPDAECKIFLTAGDEERARRRVRDLAERGEPVSFDDVLRQQQQRDREDAERDVGRLIPAEDAVHISTDGLSLDQVVDRLEQIVLSSRKCPT